MSSSDEKNDSPANEGRDEFDSRLLSAAVLGAGAGASRGSRSRGKNRNKSGGKGDGGSSSGSGSNNGGDNSEEGALDAGDSNNEDESLSARRLRRTLRGLHGDAAGATGGRSRKRGASAFHSGGGASSSGSSGQLSDATWRLRDVVTTSYNPSQTDVLSSATAVAATSGGTSSKLPANNNKDQVTFRVVPEEDLYLQGSERTLKRVGAGVNYSCVMSLKQKMSSLFKHYAK